MTRATLYRALSRAFLSDCPVVPVLLGRVSRRTDARYGHLCAMGSADISACRSERSQFDKESLRERTGGDEVRVLRYFLRRALVFDASEDGARRGVTINRWREDGTGFSSATLSPLSSKSLAPTFGER